MHRVQVNYDPTAENLQTTASPNRQIQRVPTASVETSRLDSLIKNLADHYPDFRQLQAQWQKIEVENATVEAESMSASELARKVRTGEMMAGRSPIYAATVQHIDGRNSRNKLESETLSALERGTLKFNTEEELDSYLQDQRNQLMSGASKYSLYGFDSGFARMRQKLTGFNSRLRDHEAKTYATQQLTQSMVDTVRNMDTSDEEKLESLKAQYNMFRDVGGEDQARKAFSEVATVLAAGGEVEKLDGLLRLDPGEGLRVESFIGQSQAESLRSHALSIKERRDRERMNEASLSEARKQADMQMVEDRFMSSGEIYYIGKQGEKKVFDKESYAIEKIQQQYPDPVGRINEMARYGLVDPQSSRLLKHSAELLRSFDQRWEAEKIGKDGKVEKDEKRSKQAGVSSDELKRAAAIFNTAYEINPAYARRLFADEKDYKTMEDFHFIAANMAGGDIEEAVRLTYELHKNPFVSTLSAKKAEELTDAIFSEASSWFDGNTVGNLPELRSKLSRIISINVGLGMREDVAQKKAVEHIRQSHAFVNGWAYDRTVIPPLAAGVTWEAVCPDLIDKLITDNSLPRPKAGNVTDYNVGESLAAGSSTVNPEDTSMPDRLFKNSSPRGEKAPYVTALSTYVLKHETGGYYLYDTENGARVKSPSTGRPIVIRDQEVTKYSEEWRTQKQKEAREQRKREEDMTDHLYAIGAGG